MTYYAHTAEDGEGNRLPESSGKWQPLAIHLRNVANLAAKFAAPFSAGEEAYLAGLSLNLRASDVKRGADSGLYGTHRGYAPNSATTPPVCSRERTRLSNKKPLPFKRAANFRQNAKTPIGFNPRIHLVMNTKTCLHAFTRVPHNLILSTSSSLYYLGRGLIMNRDFTIAVFRDDEIGCIAVVAAAPGLSGTGHSPAEAVSDLVFRFFAPFDDMPHPPSPEAELICVQHVTVSISSTDHF